MKAHVASSDETRMMAFNWAAILAGLEKAVAVAPEVIALLLKIFGGAAPAPPA